MEDQDLQQERECLIQAEEDPEKKAHEQLLVDMKPLIKSDSKASIQEPNTAQRKAGYKKMKTSELPSLSKVIDRRRFGTYHWVAFFSTAPLMIADGAELIVIAFLADILEELWFLSAIQKGLLGTTLYMGFMMGAFLSGPISDMFGRRIPLMISALFTIVTGIISALMPNYMSLLIMRGVVGLGIGAVVAMLTTYLAELYPKTQRGKILTLHGAFFETGEVYTCLVAYWLIPGLQGNWRAMLVMVALPLIFPLIAMLWLPESPIYLANNERFDEAIVVLDKIYKYNDDIPLDELEKEGITRIRPVTEFGMEKIFEPQYRKTTFLLFYLWFAYGFMFFGILYILPITIQESAFMPDVITDTLKTIFAEIWAVGYTMIIVDIPWIARKNGLILNFAVTSFLLAILAFLPINSSFIYIISASKFFYHASEALLSIYTVEYYPTKIRATGLGTTSTWSRIAGMVSPFAATVLAQSNPHLPYIVFFITAVIGTIAALSLEKETYGVSLDSVDEDDYDDFVVV